MNSSIKFRLATLLALRIESPEKATILLLGEVACSLLDTAAKAKRVPKQKKTT